MGQIDCDIAKLLNEETRISNDFSLAIDRMDMEESPLFFLRDKPISKIYDTMKRGGGLPRKIRETFHITDLEEIVFWLIIGEKSYVFRDSCANSFRQKIIDVWESLLSKLPPAGAIIVRRFLKNDKIDFKVNEKWCCPFSLTCTTNDINYWPLRKGENLYEIHLLPNGQTKARNVFAIYNHGIDCDNTENQVNFPKDTYFLIKDIITMSNGGEKIIMAEQ